MARSNQTFSVHRGDAVTLLVPLDMGSTGIIDMVGVTWLVGTSASATGSDIKITKTLDSGVEILTDVTTGTVTLSIDLDADDTVTLDAKTWFHAARVTDVTGRNYTVMTGKIIVWPSIGP